MPTEKYSNFATALLVTAILNPGDTALAVAPTTGSLFPSPAGGEFFRFVMVDSLVTPTKREVIYCTTRSGDNFTVLQRAQEGTIAQTWIAGNFVSLRATAGMFEQLAAASDAALLRAQLAAANSLLYGPNLVGFQQSYNGAFRTGATESTVARKLQEWVSVVDFMSAAQIADSQSGTGAVNCTAAFTAAMASGYRIMVPPGTYLLSSTPTFTSNMLWLQAGVTLTGAGRVNLGYADGGKEQVLQLGTSHTDWTSLYVRRQANHATGAAGTTAHALRADTYVTNAAIGNYEYAFVGMMNSVANGSGHFVGIYGQGIKGGTAPVWAGTFEALESADVADPATGTVGIEVDVRSGGTDTLGQRVGIDVVGSRRVPGSGTATQTGWGVRLQDAGEGASHLFVRGFGYNSGTRVFYGFDTSLASVLSAAYVMGDGQALAWDGAAAHKSYHDATGLVYDVGGVVSRLTDSGGLMLTGLLDISAAGAGQVQFPAVQNASAGANVLDDYEEGTWTPVVTFATPGDLNVAYSTQVGTYTKIGRQVIANFTITTSTFTHTTASGNLQLTGLVHQSLASGPFHGAMNWQGITKAGYSQMTPRIGASVSLIDFRAAGSAQTTAALTTADLPTGGTVVLAGSVSYLAS